jgi:hypothetical protein
VEYLTSNLKPQTSNLKPETRNQKPETRNQKPKTSLPAKFYEKIMTPAIINVKNR